MVQEDGGETAGSSHFVSGEDGCCQPMVQPRDHCSSFPPWMSHPSSHHHHHLWCPPENEDKPHERLYNEFSYTNCGRLDDVVRVSLTLCISIIWCESVMSINS